MLSALAREPLARCESFPVIAARHESWWRRTNQNPIVLAKANANPARSISRRLELLDDPGAWLAAKEADLEQTLFMADSLPSIRVDFGPVLLGALLGGQSEVGHDTTWTHAMIADDWHNAPDWQLDTDHPWWHLLLDLLERVAAMARGQYLVMTPDLGGSCDVLLNLRGSQALCMDVFEQPERITAALQAIEPAWQQAWMQLYKSVFKHNAGLIHWLGIWSNEPYVVAACDFNALIGPQAFRELCLPDIVRQARTAGRAIFHLDGPDAARHIDALLAVPEIQAIQFTPGEGTPSTLPWIDMFRKIQQAGKALYIFCPHDQITELTAQLQPQGLMLNITGAFEAQSLQDALPPAASSEV